MTERIWFRSDVVAIGSFRLAEEDFRLDRPPGVLSNLIVFPGSTHEITPRRGGDSAITDRNSVLLYNRGESYRRRFIDPVDRCDFLAFDDAWALEIAGEVDPTALVRPGRPFDRFHGPADVTMFWAARRLLSAARAGSAPAINLEMEALRLAQAAFHASRPTRCAPPRLRTARAHARLVEDVKELFASDQTEGHSLTEIANRVGASAAHLARVFRAVTGTTPHRYRRQLRLRASVDHLPRADLSRLANELGFSSHSHFTAAFRTAFACTPSQARAELAS